jgi:hypothetical protein
MMLFRLAVVPLLVLGACANPQANVAQVAQTSLVGIPKDTLLSCAGVPDRSHLEGPREFFTYDSEQVVSYPTATVGIGTFSDNFGFGIGVPLASRDVIRSDYCETTFVIDNGIVSEVNYTSTTGMGSGRYAQCGRIVQNCVAVTNPAALQGAYGQG